MHPRSGLSRERRERRARDPYVPPEPDAGELAPAYQGVAPEAEDARRNPKPDLVIAALALEGSHILAHRDEHFELVKEVEPGIRTLNFAGPCQ